MLNMDCGAGSYLTRAKRASQYRKRYKGFDMPTPHNRSSRRKSDREYPCRAGRFLVGSYVTGELREDLNRIAKGLGYRSRDKFLLDMYKTVAREYGQNQRLPSPILPSDSVVTKRQKISLKKAVKVIEAFTR